MKRIDLHIHTKKTVSDNLDYEFSIDFLKRYIEFAQLDGIAITNHNVFDLEQFMTIKKEMEITVLPGVEVDLEKGHLLVIAPLDRIEEFDAQCKQLSTLIKTQDCFIGISDFEKIFSNYEDYLLIPHFDKKPKLNNTTIELLDSIIAGEVQSPKKFLYMKNGLPSLTPVIFSDLRMYERDSDTFHFPNRFTYIDINEIDIPSIKLALLDKSKVRITSNDDENLFDILPNKIKASTKLNLVVGKRSTGKTYTLDRILSSLQDNYSNNVKYIRQFQIVKESENSAFSKIMEDEKKEMLKEYLTPLKDLVDKVMCIDIAKIQEELKVFIDSLCSYADSQSLNDEYSKCTLFSESNFNKKFPKEIEELTEASNKILIENNNEYKEIINKYITDTDLINLTSDLSQQYRIEYTEYTLKKKTDEIFNPIKDALGVRSAIDPIEDIDLSDYFIKYKTTELFNKYICQLNVPKEILRKDLFRFDAILSKKPFESAAEIKNEVGGKGHVPALKLYKDNKYYSYLIKLKELECNEELLYNSLFNFNLEICNKHDTPISHGERAEYNLLRNLQDSYNYDVLLLDEPEASFDNIFIHEFVIPTIKKISEDLTVFLVTHNNTLGSNIMPDHIIYTDFDEMKYSTEEYSKEECFNIFSGSFDSQKLLSSNENHESNYNALINTMEAGESAYKTRREIYENLRNK